MNRSGKAREPFDAAVRGQESIMAEANHTSSDASEAPPPVLELRGVGKTFSGVHVLAGVDFSVRSGEVMGLVGENGAGKSTLMRIVTGIYDADPGGTIRFDGNEIHFTNTRQSIDAGIAMIHQELNLLSGLTVGENLFLGREPLNRLGLIDWPTLMAESRRHLAAVRQTIDPSMLIGRLSVGQQQMVEIARALSLNARLIVMDEPTGALTDVETDILFEAIRHLRDQGKAIVYISHRLGEIFQICDSVTVLRDGRMVFTGPASGLNEAALIHHMVGREITEKYPYTHSATGPVSLRVSHLSAPVVEDISFEGHAGEVIGFAGLMGAGGNQLGKTLYGAMLAHSGSIEVNGRALSLHTPEAGVRAGIAYLPEDRKAEGLIQIHSVRVNMTLAALRRFSIALGLIARGREDGVVAGYVETFQIRTPSVEAAVATLSGGNQQKVALAKALMTEPTILILDEPTRGVDVGARRDIYSLINELKAKGLTILLISSDMPELLGVADRILVLSRGRLTGAFGRDEATQEAIMKCAVA
jgi:ribose transport system ATP-binding protein